MQSAFGMAARLGTWRAVGQLVQHLPSSSSSPSPSHMLSAAARGLGVRPALARAYRSSAEMAGGVSLVQGSSRGIGREFVQQLLANRKEGCVIATCRDPAGAADLNALHERYPGRLEIIKLDVTQPETIEEAAKHIADTYGRLDLLVNTSGVLHIPNVMRPETSLAKCEMNALMTTYQVNAAGPLLVAKAMHQLLRKGGGKGTGRPAAVIANVSARVGSIGDNRLGGWYSYRASKSALNQLTKTMSVEFARKRDPIIAVLLHPGTVATDLSKPFQGNVPEGKLFTPQLSVGKLLSVIDELKTEDNGKFFDWEGKEIPW